MQGLIVTNKEKYQYLLLQVVEGNPTSTAVSVDAAADIDDGDDYDSNNDDTNKVYRLFVQ